MQTTNISRLHQALLVISLYCLLLPAVASGYQYDAGEPDSYPGVVYPSRFQILLDRAVREGLTGASLHVSGPGLEFTGAAGVASLSSGEPLTPDHSLYAASLGKPFTAVLALQLCNEGAIELDVPISRWLPHDVTRRLPSSETITLRQLLNHTSGLIDYMNDQKAWRGEFVRDPNRQWTHADIVPYIYGKPLRFQPGSDFDYSNSNYILVGLIIERVTGRPYPTLVRERIIEPLGLRSTFVGGANAGGKRRAHGYISRRGRTIDTFPWYRRYGLADSGIHSTPKDLALFFRTLFASDRILNKNMRKEMLRVSNAGAPPSRYGIGIYVERDSWGAGKLWYQHDGIDPGYQADMMYLPDHDVVIVLAANTSLGKASRIYQRLITAVVDTVLESIH